MEDRQSLYLRTTNLWKNLCKFHNELYEVTCDEYQALLESRLEDLEQIIEEKKMLISNIESLDKVRQDLIDKMDAQSSNSISNVKDILNEVEEFESQNNERHLLRFNKLLIDIIEKIQYQNKKNRLFLNKAHMSLDELKDLNLGKKNFSTYNAKGVSSGKGRAENI